jgi:hypothetical protein
MLSLGGQHRVERQYVLGIDRARVSVMRLSCFGNEPREIPKRLRDSRSLRQQTLVGPKIGEGRICGMRCQTGSAEDERGQTRKEIRMGDLESTHGPISTLLKEKVWNS